MTRYAKALAALLTALAAWGATAAPDGYQSAELWGLAAVAAAGLTVYAVPNRPPRGRRRRTDMSEQSPAAG